MQRLKEEKGSKRLSEGIMCLCCVLSLLLASCNSDPYADCRTWEERETLLIQKYEKSDKDFNRLMLRWLSEPEASSYPFDSLQMDRPFCKTASCVYSVGIPSKGDSPANGILSSITNMRARNI